MVSDSQPQFGMVVRPDVMVPMRDGVKLAMDVYLPVYRGSGPFPVGLTRTPCNQVEEGASSRWRLVL